MYLMLLWGLAALWPTHDTTSHVRVRSFRPHQRPPRPGRSRAEHASASRPLQRPIRPSRARAPAELRSAASNIVQSWQPASRRQTRLARCPPTPLPSPRTSPPGAQSPPWNGTFRYILNLRYTYGRSSVKRMSVLGCTYTQL